MTEFYKSRLMAPGPVEVPPTVLEALARPTLHHRSAAFRELFVRVRGRLAELALVPGDDLLILTASGTAAFEAGLLACVPAGAPVLSLDAGKFGARWHSLARRFGYRAERLEFPWGRAADPERLREALRRTPGVAAVTLVHSETSTGVLHDVEALARVVREEAPEALVLVDCVTSLSVVELRPREWLLDGVFSGSQKGLMLPPGLAFAWLSERAWARSEAHVEALTPSFYLDLRRERAAQRDGQTAYTPAVNLVVALDAALDLLLEQGPEALWARRARLNEALLAAGEALELTRFAERPSPALAALRTPEGVAAPALVTALAARGVRVAGGQDHLKPHLLRPSLLGWADRYDAVALAAALEDGLRDLGHPREHGRAVAAALRALDAAPLESSSASP